VAVAVAVVVAGSEDEVDSVWNKKRYCLEYK
jgi:hypothetical protein